MYIIFLTMKKKEQKKQEQYQFLQSSAKEEFQLLYQTLLKPKSKVLLCNYYHKKQANKM